MDWSRIEVMVRYLRHSAIAKDTKIFNQYMRGEIEIKECISRFRKNNGIPERFTIIEDEFIEWLWSLGYRRGI